MAFTPYDKEALVSVTLTTFATRDVKPCAAHLSFRKARSVRPRAVTEGAPWVEKHASPIIALSDARRRCRGELHPVANFAANDTRAIRHGVSS